MLEEIDLYRQELRWVLEEISQSLRDFTPEQLHWRPATNANSAAAIVTHVVSTTRVYVLGFGCGQPVTRNRPAEFLADGLSKAALLTAVDQLLSELDIALMRLTAAELERRLLPPQALWGATTEAREISAREALLMALRHAALHLGELRLTHDLAAGVDTAQ
jgi:uncharacterized damage-inducible protein DinB